MFIDGELGVSLDAEIFRQLMNNLMEAQVNFNVRQRTMKRKLITRYTGPLNYKFSPVTATNIIILGASR
jgi:hypothetical protein